MSAEVYAITSGKGGTGKTTTAINLGVSLAGLGKRALVIDADMGMANVGLLLGMDVTAGTFYDYISGTADVEDIIYEGPGGLKIIPGSISLENLGEFDTDTIRRLIEELSSKFDYILLDTAPGIGKETACILEAVNNSFLIVNPEISSIIDSIKIKIFIDMKGNRIKGVLLNRVTDSDEMSKEKVEEILELPVTDKIPEDPLIKKSVVQRMPVVLHTPGSDSSIAFKSIAARMAGYDIKLDESHNEKVKKGLFQKIISLLLKRN